MQSVNLMQAPRDESTKSLHDYLSNNYYKNLLALSLILMFAIVFYLIYLLVDAFIDKERHYRLALTAFEAYERGKNASALRKQQLQPAGKKSNDSSNSSNGNTGNSLVASGGAKLSNRKHTSSGNHTSQQQDHHVVIGAMEGGSDEATDDHHSLQQQGGSVAAHKEAATERTRKLDFTIWSYRNLQVSFIHSVLCSAWLARILCMRGTEMLADPVTYVSWDTYLLLAFSCGYFLYDFYDIYANGYARIEWVVCVHHWIVLVCFGYHLVYIINIGYTTLALCMEFNSVFLHARKLLKFYAQRRDSPLVLANKLLNLLTFVLFRFGTLALIVVGIVRDGHRVSLPYLVMLVVCTLAMAVINVVLFKRIVCRDWLAGAYTNAAAAKKTASNLSGSGGGGGGASATDPLTGAAPAAATAVSSTTTTTTTTTAPHVTKQDAESLIDIVCDNEVGGISRQQQQQQQHQFVGCAAAVTAAVSGSAAATAIASNISGNSSTNQMVIKKQD